MNLSTAHEILNRAAYLLELTATFQARYGAQSTLKPGSPDDAWNLHDAIFAQQNEIAHLLDPEALDVTQHKHGVWWQRQDVIDTATVLEIIAQASRLISGCAYFGAAPCEMEAYALHNVQRTLAGLLHRNALMIAMDDAEQATLRAG